jgi:hypothetical protein
MLPTRQEFHVGTVESTLKELTLSDEPLVGWWVLKLGKKHCGISGALDTIHLPWAHGSRQVEFNSRLPARAAYPASKKRAVVQQLPD